MDAYGTARLAAKEAESAIVARICEDFNLTPGVGAGVLRADGPLFLRLRPGGGAPG
jgi:hypothetical protein